MHLSSTFSCTGINRRTHCTHTAYHLLCVCQPKSVSAPKLRLSSIHQVTQ